ncbi:hypothetical protein ACLKA6_017587 [Drosophila palustris]
MSRSRSWKYSYVSSKTKEDKRSEEGDIVRPMCVFMTIPIFYILAIVPGLMPWDSGFKFLSFCHVFGSVAPWCGSFIYHLFMNIEKGENVYYRLLKLDMVGIWVSQSFGK